MSTPSPSMAVRLAVTLGATALLTIGAVGVGAATSGSDKDESSDEVVEPKDRDKSTDATTTTSQNPPDEDSTSAADPETLGTTTPAGCLYELAPLKNDPAVLFLVSSDAGSSKLVARVKVAAADRQAEETFREACGERYDPEQGQVEFCSTVKVPRQAVEVTINRGDDDAADFRLILGEDGTDLILPAAAVQFCDSDGRSAPASAPRGDPPSSMPPSPTSPDLGSVTIPTFQTTVPPVTVDPPAATTPVDPDVTEVGA